MAEGTGPYKVIIEGDPALPTHTIYRPEDLKAVKGKMPDYFLGQRRMREFFERLPSISYGDCLARISSGGHRSGGFGREYALPAAGSGWWSGRRSRSAAAPVVREALAVPEAAAEQEEVLRA